jgi:hypothetical protein
VSIGGKTPVIDNFIFFVLIYNHSIDILKNHGSYYKKDIILEQNCHTNLYMLTIGIIREGKNPPDHRVVLSPAQCKYLMDSFPVRIKVQPSKNRCFSDAEYEKEGISLFF